jgi:hypothetical protein
VSFSPQSPLRKWTRAASHNNAIECEIGKFKGVDNAKTKGDGSVCVTTKCVASDDRGRRSNVERRVFIPIVARRSPGFTFVAGIR